MLPLTEFQDMPFAGGLVGAYPSFNGIAVVCLSISGHEVGVRNHDIAHRLLERVQPRWTCDGEWLAVVAGNSMKVKESLFSGPHLSNMSQRQDSGLSMDMDWDFGYHYRQPKWMPYCHKRHYVQCRCRSAFLLACRVWTARRPLAS